MNGPTALYAYASKDAYVERSKSDVDVKTVALDGHLCRIFAYESGASGFHATAYQQTEPPHRIVIAYRGTDTDFRDHTLTGIQDVAVDTMMVADRFNPQEVDARRFTQAVLDKAAVLHIPRELVTVTGHSKGGTLAQAEAWRFGLRGQTFNAYGAVELGLGIPEGGDLVIDNVLAGDPVSAASHHFGHVRVYATPADVGSLQDAGYLDGERGIGHAWHALRFSDHGIDNFAPDPGQGHSVLTTGNASRADRYAEPIAAFRRDAWATRAGLHVATHVPLTATWGLARVTEAAEMLATTGLHAKAESERLGRVVTNEVGRAWHATQRAVERGGEAIAHTASDVTRAVGREWAAVREGWANTTAPQRDRKKPAGGPFPAAASGVGTPWAPVGLGGAKAPLLNEPAHPGHRLHVAAFNEVKRMETRHGLPTGAHSERVAAALVVAAQRGGLRHIDRVEPSQDRTKVVAVQGDLRSPFRKLAHVDTVQAASTPLEQSSARALAAQEAQVEQTQVMHEPARDVPQQATLVSMR